MRHWTTLILLLSCIGTVSAQTDLPLLEDALQNMADNEASALQTEEQAAALHELLASPINLNDSTEAERLPYVSHFQLRALHNYIILHGPLISLKELVFVPGWDSATIAFVSPLVCLKPVEASQTIGQMLRRGRHTLVAGLDERAFLSYSFKAGNHISLRICADKDAGEKWLEDNFYNYHLMVTDIGRLEKLIVGRYNLQFGQGATLWTGFSPFTIAGHTPSRFASGIRQASAFYEEGYQEGVATTVKLPLDLHLSGFASWTGEEQLYGTHLDYRNEHLVIGLTAMHTHLEDSVMLRNYAYNQNYFRGQRLNNFGADLLWQYGRVMVYGELGLAGDSLRLAGIGGVRLFANNQNHIGMAYRYYDPQYHNLHAQAYAMGSTMNEQGLTFDAQTRLPGKINVSLSIDQHRYPSLRYANYHPSAGWWLRSVVSRDIGHWGTASLRYSCRIKDRNIPNLDSTLYLGESTLRQQLQGQLTASLGHWRLAGRGIYTHFDSENGAPQQGWLASAEARYTRGPWQITTRATYFDIDGYYARVYLNEGGFLYSYSMPMLYGNGVRLFALARFKMSRHIVIGLRYTLTHYTSVTEEPTQQQLHLQVHCNF